GFFSKCDRASAALSNGGLVFDAGDGLMAMINQRDLE
ncbi:MAG: hypothetical protein RL474_118, partial [Pseudomonadota bacterium]